MAWEGSAGVEKTFNMRRRRVAGSIQTQSVKVPPVSMAMRRGWGGGAWMCRRKVRLTSEIPMFAKTARHGAPGTRAGHQRHNQGEVTFAAMRYAFLVETYATERMKVSSVWSEFLDRDLAVRPREGDPRGRSVHEQMVHQCVSEDLWFRNMLGIDVGAPPLPARETRMEFMKRYAEDSGKRLTALGEKDESWWEGETLVLRSAAVACMGDGAEGGAYVASSRTVDGDAADAGTGRAQQLWADGGHGRVDGESCSDDLCVSELGGCAGGWTKGEAAGGGWEGGDGEAVSRGFGGIRGGGRP